MSTITDVRGQVADTVDYGAAGEISRRMDSLPLTWLHITTVALAGTGFAFDMMEVALGNVLSVVFSAPPYSVAPGQLSLLLSAMFIGAIPGALGAGWLADRYGRKMVLIGVLLLLAVTSIAAATSPGINTLIVARIASGLALGAYPPLIISYLTDLLPARRRGMLILMVSGFAALGPVAIVFIVRWLTPLQPLGLEAWRWAFLIGTAGSLIIALALFAVPESPRWLAARGRRAEAEAALARFTASPPLSGAAAVQQAPTTRPAMQASPPVQEGFDRKRFTLLGALYFVAPWATVTFPLLMGAALIEKGFQLSDSLLYLGVSMFGPFVASVLAAFVIDRLERRAALIVFSLGMIVSAVVFAGTVDPALLMISGAGFQIFGLLHVPMLTIYAAELFPTAYRARTSTAAWSINRVASAVAPLILLPLLKTVGIWPMVSIVLVMLGLGIVLAALGPRGRAGQAVD